MEPASAPRAIERPLAVCRPTLARYLQTWLPAVASRSRFREVRNFLLFIGYPRSGHTLIGSLLNAHPNALIGHELNVLHYVKRRFTRAQIYWMLHRQDQAFDAIGRQWTTYNYQVPNQWQGRCDGIHVIGDKHGNGATSLLGVRPDVLARLRKAVSVPVKMLHIVRHPLDSIATMSCKYQIPVPDAAKIYFSLCEINRRLLDDPANDVLTVHLEDFVRQPRQELLKTLGFLNLKAEVGYLNDCASIVLPEARQSRSTIDWAADALQMISDQAPKFRFLDPYALAKPAEAHSTRHALRAA